MRLRISELPINISKKETLFPDTNISPLPTQSSKIVDDFTPNPTTKDSVFAQITIETDRKTKTFDVMSDVDEKTLRNNIGWLPSSALPGQEGLCILMGHRDTDFRVLEYICIGNDLIVTREGISCSYMVTDIEVIEDDSALNFKSLTGSNLVLVTCYPFHYTGYAPKKLVVFSQLLSNYT